MCSMTGNRAGCMARPINRKADVTKGGGVRILAPRIGGGTGRGTGRWHPSLATAASVDRFVTENAFLRLRDRQDLFIA